MTTTRDRKTVCNQDWDLGILKTLSAIAKFSRRILQPFFHNTRQCEIKEKSDSSPKKNTILKEHSRCSHPSYTTAVAA